MSGAEALAIIPLIISATEHWVTLVKPFKKLKHFGQEARTLRSRIQTERDVFQMQIALLLSEPRSGVVEYEEACDMVRDGNHAQWGDEHVRSGVNSFLGDLQNSYEFVLSQINHGLEKLLPIDAKITQTLEDDGEQASSKQTKDASRRKNWKDAVAVGLNIIFRDSCLDEAITRLRSLNQQLQSLIQLCDQVVQVKDQKVNRSRYLVLPHRDKKDIAAARSTSMELYEAIQTCCGKHTSHVAYLSLVPTINDVGSVQYDLAFRSHAHTTSLSSDTSIWLSVETTYIQSNISQLPIAQSLCDFNRPDDISSFQVASRMGQGKRPRDSEHTRDVQDIVQDTSVIKKVHFNDSLKNPSRVVSELALPPNLEDIWKGGNFCTKILHASRNIYSIHITREPIGMMCGHHRLVYIKTNNGKALEKKLVPLAAVLTQCEGKICLEGFPLPSRIRFAKNLAIASMRYDSTPWLNDGWWTADSIRIATSGEDSLNDAYLGKLIEQKAHAIESPDLDAKDPLISNLLLLGLAIILIEIALLRPLRSLALPCDTGEGATRDCRTAKRLLPLVRTSMPQEYVNVIKKCISFSFEVDLDLNGAEFQDRFYSDVVYALQELEKKVS